MRTGGIWRHSGFGSRVLFLPCGVPFSPRRVFWTTGGVLTRLWKLWKLALKWYLFTEEAIEQANGRKCQKFTVTCLLRDFTTFAFHHSAYPPILFSDVYMSCFYSSVFKPCFLAVRESSVCECVRVYKNYEAPIYCALTCTNIHCAFPYSLLT